MLKPHDLRHSVALECLTNITTWRSEAMLAKQ